MFTHLTAACLVALSAGVLAPAHLPTVAQPESQSKQDASLPDGFTVLERYAEAIGGAEKYKQYETCEMRGTLKSSLPDDKGTIVIKQKAPHDSHVTIAFEENGTITQGTTSDMAWAVQPGMPVQRFTGKSAEPMIMEAGFYNPVEPREVYASAETVGVEEYDGVECYKLLLVTRWGQQQSGLFEVESGLHRQKQVYAGNSHEMVMNTTEYDDYRETGGIKRPFKMTIRMMGITQSAAFDTIEFGVTIDADTFEPPAP